MRVTQNSIAGSVLANLQGNLSRLGQTQERLSSGKLVSRASDAPGGAVSAMQLRSEISTTQQYKRNADDGIGWLDTVDTALNSTIAQTHRARELVLQGKSAATAGSAEAREAIAVEIDNLRQSMVGLANSTYLGRPVFGGTTPGNVAYNPDGTYAGDSGEVKRTVGPNTKVRVDSSGPEVFGTGNTQLFKVLSDVADHLRNNPSALGDDLKNLDTAFNRVQSGLSNVGAHYNQVTRMQQTADDNVIHLTQSLSNIEDIDLPKEITDLQLQQTAYQAALAAGARVVQPSLLDFLK
jgi:flagellar hook-associated protein 3 FlgL